ncbi:MAG: PEP-CTERM sorting domain-containing protein [Candidatus Korobacteraceae bacterium]
MHHLRGMLLVLCLCLFSVAAFADSVRGDFTIDSSGGTVASQGYVTFTLEGNGTIDASLTITNGATIVGFGFNSATADLPESNFAPVQPANADGWIDAFGYQPSGFYCPSCGTTETWTIEGGPYSSVYNVLNGPPGQSTVDFFLYDSNGQQWGAQATTVGGTTPEPASLLLLGTGVLGVLGSIRRKLM